MTATIAAAAVGVLLAFMLPVREGQQSAVSFSC